MRLLLLLVFASASALGFVAVRYPLGVPSRLSLSPQRSSSLPSLRYTPRQWEPQLETRTRTPSPPDTTQFDISRAPPSDTSFIFEAMNSLSPIDVRGIVGPKEVIVYDTTLRDGTQGESISISSTDKLKIASHLSGFGMDYVEAGWPGSNPKDREFFDRANGAELGEAVHKLVAFGSTRRRGVDASEDKQIAALIDSGTPTVCIVAKGHAWQVEEILRTTREENLAMISDSVSYLCSHGRRVFVDLEHFFDGYAHDPMYALECCRAASEAGARCLVLCDTNGGSMPWQIGDAVQEVMAKLGGPRGVTVGIHCHNDCGMAVANSVVACQNGAGMVQGTVNGIGERTGNANLCSVVPALGLHVGSDMTCRKSMDAITGLSRTVSEVMNQSPDTSAPFVGSSAFAHKGGLHVAAMERHSDSYQHIDPAAVGNQMRVLISELSGRQNIMKKIKDAGFITNDDDHSWNERALAILDRVKKLENIGYTFEGAEASVHLMVLHATRGYCSPFKVVDYNAFVFGSDIDSASRVVAKMSATSRAATARATVKVHTIATDEDTEFDGSIVEIERLEVCDGSGPIDALSSALMKALLPSHPYLSNIELTDYKVRILDPKLATGAASRVMIEFRDNFTETTWSTVSVDRNVISASLNALVDGYEYALIEQAQLCMLCDDFFE